MLKLLKNQMMLLFLSMFILVICFGKSHAFSINPDDIVRGGAIQAVNTSITIKGQDASNPLVLSHNIAQSHGGAIYAYASDKTLLNTDKACMTHFMPNLYNPSFSDAMVDLYPFIAFEDYEYYDEDFWNKTPEEATEHREKFWQEFADGEGLSKEEAIDLFKSQMDNLDLNEANEALNYYIAYIGLGAGCNNGQITGFSLVINILDNVTISNNTIYKKGFDIGYGGAFYFDAVSDSQLFEDVHQKGELRVNFIGNNINIENNGSDERYYDSLPEYIYLYGGFAYILQATEVNFSGNINIKNNAGSLPAGAIMFRQVEKVNFNEGSVITATENEAVSGYGGVFAFYNNPLNHETVELTVTANFNGTMYLGTTADNELLKDDPDKYDTTLGNIAGFGGAMYFFPNDYSTIKVNFNGEIIATGNIAQNGGVMYFSPSYSSSVEVNLNGTIIATDNGARFGGVMYFEADKSTLMVNFNEGSNITANNNITKGSYSSGGGGAMYFSVSSSSYDESTMTVNFNEGSNITANNNSSHKHGGAMYFNYVKKVNFNKGSNITANNNTAYNNGGAMYFRDCGEVNFNGPGVDEHGNATTGSVITATGNTATGDGGAMYFVGDNASVMSVNFNEGGVVTAIGNRAANNGGAIYFDANETASMSVNFDGKMELTENGKDADGNVITKNGGAIYFNNLSSSLNINFGTKNNLIFTNNSVSGNGGALYFNPIDKIDFYGKITASNNNASGNGGAMYFNALPAVNFYGEMALTENEAYLDGGGMHFHISSSYSTTVRFNNNKDMRFKGNIAGEDGGGINFDGNDTSSGLNVNFNANSKLFFEGNSAKNGGGISFVAYKSTVNVNFNDNCYMYFSGNRGFGGAMYFYNAEYHLTNAFFDAGRSDLKFSDNGGTSRAMTYRNRLVNFKNGIFWVTIDAIRLKYSIK